jgi:hypothetical protein
MTGAVNPYQRKQPKQTANTNEQQQHTDGSSTVPDTTATSDACQS